MREPEMMDYSIDRLVLRAAALIGGGAPIGAPGTRRILGITGAPGAGKSTLAADVVARLGRIAACVPMDGFHLAGSVLAALGRAGRKGAPDTFDDAGYAALLERLRRGGDAFAPEFRREIEEPVAAGIFVPASVRIVVTEGNYLLQPDGAWPAARACLDEVWQLELDGNERRRRLAVRHERFGKSPSAAREWADGSDENNAQVVDAAAGSADLIVRMPA